MKIAFFLYHWPVLSETFILNQLTWLLDRGHEVAVFCKSPSLTGETIEHEDIKRYDLANKTYYYGTPDQRMPSNRFVRIVKAFWITTTQLFNHPKPLLKSLNIFKYGRMASSLGMFYLTVPFFKWDMQRYEIACCHFGPNGELAATLKELGVIDAQIVTIFHGEAGYTGKMKMSKGLETLFRLGQRFLPMSEKEKSNLIQRRCPLNRIRVHHMGVDINRFVFDKKWTETDGKIRLYSVGRLVEKKGFEYSIRALANIVKRFQNVDYFIIGDGPLRPQIETLIQDLGIDAKIKLLGSMTQEEVIEQLKTAHLFIAPSIKSQTGDQEGIPVVIMEAMALGLPTVATRHAGIPELVEDGRSGYLVSERDVDALAHAITRLLEHPESWSQLGKAGRAKVVSDFNIDTLNEQLMEMFRTI